jgi:RNA polymerase-binding transcription factor DksA
MSFYRFCKECRTERNIEPPRKINHSDVCYFCDQRDPEMRRLNLDGAPVCIKCSMHYRRNLDDGEL